MKDHIFPLLKQPSMAAFSLGEKHIQNPYLRGQNPTQRAGLLNLVAGVLIPALLLVI